MDYDVTKSRVETICKAIKDNQQHSFDRAFSDRSSATPFEEGVSEQQYTDQVRRMCERDNIYLTHEQVQHTWPLIHLTWLNRVSILILGCYDASPK